MSKFSQRGIYFSADLNAKIDAWIGLHPHVKISHLVRAALFEYFEKHRINQNVDLTANNIPKQPIT